MLRHLHHHVVVGPDGLEAHLVDESGEWAQRRAGAAGGDVIGAVAGRAGGRAATGALGGHEALIPVIVALEDDVDLVLVEDRHQRRILPLLVRGVPQQPQHLLGVDRVVQHHEAPALGVRRQHLVQPGGLVGELGGAAVEADGGERDDDGVAVGEVVVVLGAAAAVCLARPGQVHQPVVVGPLPRHRAVLVVAQRGHDRQLAAGAGGEFEVVEPLLFVRAVLDQVAAQQEEARLAQQCLLGHGGPSVGDPLVFRPLQGAAVPHVGEAERAALGVWVDRGAQGVLRAPASRGPADPVVVGRVGAQPGQRDLAHRAGGGADLGQLARGALGVAPRRGAVLDLCGRRAGERRPGHAHAGGGVVHKRDPHVLRRGERHAAGRHQCQQHQG